MRLAVCLSEGGHHHLTLTSYCLPQPILVAFTSFEQCWEKQQPRITQECCSQPPQIGIWWQTTETCFLAKRKVFHLWLQISAHTQ